MKRFILIALASGLIAGNAVASAILVKEKAKQFRDQNNQQQGVPAQPGYPAAPPGAPPSGAQGISSAQQQLIAKLQTDLGAIKPGATVAAEQKEQLQTDCAALAKGVSRPTKEALTKLANDLSAALAGKAVSAGDQAQLAKAINVVMNSGNLSAAQVQIYVNAAQTALKNSGITGQDAENVVTDLKSIVAELLKNKPKLYQ
ncbi:MAG TPA: hypothetical protein VH598_01720 [Verrucomicrobiae bacterium]|nr:hypothetical protein [Verrucomicrobiae bacterium]